MPTCVDRICATKYHAEGYTFVHNQASASLNLKLLVAGTKPMPGCLALQRFPLTNGSTAHTSHHELRCRGLNSRGVHSRRRTLPDAHSGRHDLCNCRVKNAYTRHLGGKYGNVAAAQRSELAYRLPVHCTCSCCCSIPTGGRIRVAYTV